MYLINSKNGRLKIKIDRVIKKTTQVRYKCSHIENVVATGMLVTMLCLQPLSPTSVTNIDVARYNRLDHYLFTDCIIPAVLNQNDYVTIFRRQYLAIKSQVQCQFQVQMLKFKYEVQF